MEKILLLSLIVLSVSCDFNSEKVSKIKPFLLNLDGINTAYDYYNSTGAVIYFRQ